MREKIGRRTVDRLKARGGWLNDKEVRGFAARRLPSGRVQYLFRYQVDGRRRFKPLGLDGETTPEEALKAALALRAELRAGNDPVIVEQAARTAAEAEEMRRTKGAFASVAASYIKRVAKKQNRSWRETLRIFRKYVPRDLRRRPVDEIGRLDVARLLDRVEDQNGPVMADRVLAALRRLFNWHATRDGAFASPIVKGMARTKPKERARDRILSDAELRALWAATERTEPAIFGRFVRVLLLTAQRRGEVAEMRWREIEGDVWTVPAERYKTKRANVVPLSDAVKGVLDGIRHRGEFVFSTDKGKRALGGFTKAKRALDKRMLAELRKVSRKATLPPWTLHDLRRTARTLMAAAGVRPDISERVLGHVIAGVGGVYDRHDYRAEKAAALAALAQRLEIALKGEAAKILDMRKPPARAA